LRVTVTDLAIGRVSPFGHPGITARVQLPQAYRSLPRPSSPLDAKASTVCLIAFDLKFDLLAHWLLAQWRAPFGAADFAFRSTASVLIPHTRSAVAGRSIIHPSIVKEQGRSMPDRPKEK
jgi:hypothetical protein